ncbi:MAG: hypothetical protein KJ072_13125, partial [Verrucomicrobia bacterium]|nr:hypothetical protein [Verrucomicrobiota bacterium]
KQDPDFRESWMGFIPVEKQLIARALSEAPFARAAGPCPVVLFSAGWKGWTWRQTSTKAQELASHGYVVVWVTHYDATWACLPNQRVTYQTDDQVPFTAPGLLDRVQDLRFVLEQLQQWNQVGGEFTGCFDLEAVAAIGFSWGTYSAAEFCRLEPRCRAVIQLDCDAGAETAPDLVRLGLQKPILILNRADNFKTDLYDKATEDAVWAQISGSAHANFSDGYWVNFPNDLDRSQEIVLTLRAYVLWFLNKHLKGSTDPMPALADYPRVINFKQK